MEACVLAIDKANQRVSLGIKQTEDDPWSLIDSRFKGPDANRTKMPHAIKPEGNLNTIRNITFLNVGYGINANSEPTGLMVQDNDAPTDYGLRGYLLWAQGKDIVVLGNKVVNSTHEHPMRFWEVERVNVAYNDLDNPSVHSFETLKTAFNFQAGKYATILGHPVSMGHGLTLTRGQATIWPSPTSNLELYVQGARRVYRITQTRKTENITLVAKDTYEEYVYELLNTRDARMTKLLDMFADNTTTLQ